MKDVPNITPDERAEASDLMQEWFDCVGMAIEYITDDEMKDLRIAFVLAIRRGREQGLEAACKVVRKQVDGPAREALCDDIRAGAEAEWKAGGRHG